MYSAEGPFGTKMSATLAAEAATERPDKTVQLFQI